MSSQLEEKHGRRDRVTSKPTSSPVGAIGEVVIALFTVGMVLAADRLLRL